MKQRGWKPLIPIPAEAGPQALERGRIFTGLAARVEVVPFPIVVNPVHLLAAYESRPLNPRHCGENPSLPRAHGFRTLEELSVLRPAKVLTFH